MNIPHTHFTSLLKEKLRLPLPGEVAQFKMAHAARYSLATVAPATAKVASVMILLFPKEENTHFILIERVQTAGDAHSGQISFPGGKRDFSDIDLAQTALRETEEEIGVARQEIHLLGKLTPLYIPVSDFLVHPFVGSLPQTPTFTPQPNEVRQILEIAFADLLLPEVRKTTTLTVAKNIQLENVKYFDLSDKIVWGATAMILSEFLEVCNFSTPK